MAAAHTCSGLDPAAIKETYGRISQHIHRTPVITSRALDGISSCADPRSPLVPNSVSRLPSTLPGPEVHPPAFRLFFKCENFQRTGAFKARGAFSAMLQLQQELGIDELRKTGVTTVSSGNHAQGLALAAATFGVPATIVMPRSSTASKIAGVASYLGIDNLHGDGGTGPHGEIVYCGSSNEEKKSAVANVVRDRGMLFVPPYEHPNIILGQGTCALELDEQFEQLMTESGPAHASLDAVIAPLGGGGLLGGVATWFSDKHTRVFGAEPSFGGADDAVRGLKQGKRITSVSSSTIADGLRTPVGALNWSIVSDPAKVTGVFSVSDEEIRLAMKLLMERAKLFVEPSACVPLAAILFNEEFRKKVADMQRADGSGVWNVGVVLSGGNTTLDDVAKIVVATA